MGKGPAQLAAMPKPDRRDCTLRSRILQNTSYLNPVLKGIIIKKLLNTVIITHNFKSARKNIFLTHFQMVTAAEYVPFSSPKKRERGRKREVLYYCTGSVRQLRIILEGGR